jgi:DNA-binding PadR family transcriptional regulator
MSKRKQFVQKNVPLTAPIFYILLSLATKERHGYDIMKRVESESQGKVKLGAGTLYGAIKRMLEDRLIVDIESEHARRKYYKLTEKGRAIFINELQRYNEAVELAKKKNIFSVPITKPLAIAYV